MDKVVVELFAGVGGFRIGLNEVQFINDKVIEKNNFKFAWVNQWEPSTGVQHAFDCYIKRFGDSENHVNKDISLIDKKKNSKPYFIGWRISLSRLFCCKISLERKGYSREEGCTLVAN